MYVLLRAQNKASIHTNENLIGGVLTVTAPDNVLQTPNDEQWRVTLMLMVSILNHQLATGQVPVAQELSITAPLNGGVYSFSTAIKVDQQNF